MLALLDDAANRDRDLDAVWLYDQYTDVQVGSSGNAGDPCSLPLYCWR